MLLNCYVFFKKVCSDAFVLLSFFFCFSQTWKKTLRLHITAVSKFRQTSLKTFGGSEFFLYVFLIVFFLKFLSFSLRLLLMLLVLLLHQRQDLVKYGFEAVSVTLNEAVNNNQHLERLCTHSCSAFIKHPASSRKGSL